MSLAILPFDKTLIILPTYNENENIGKLIAALHELSPMLSILVIDDNSPDGTAVKVKDLQKNNSKLFLLERPKKMGLGSAYIMGFKWALPRGMNYIFEMDSDFSHDPGEVANLLKAAMNADLVIGSRYVNGIRIINWPFRRLLLSYCASIYTRFITGIPILDTTGGFKCFTRKALETINLDKIITNGYAFQLEMNYKIWSKGMKVVEVPIIFYERRDGQSKMNKKIIIEAVFAVFRLRFLKLIGKL